MLRKCFGAICASMMMILFQVVPAHAMPVLLNGTYVMHSRCDEDYAVTIVDGPYGDVLVMDKFGDAAKQQFTIEPVGDDGLFMIRLANTDLYLDADGTRTADGHMQIMARKYTGNKAQLWFAEIADEGNTYTIYSAYSGKKDRIMMRYSEGKVVLDMEYAVGKNYTWQLDKVNG